MAGTADAARSGLDLQPAPGRFAGESSPTKYPTRRATAAGSSSRVVLFLVALLRFGK